MAIVFSLYGCGGSGAGESSASNEYTVYPSRADFVTATPTVEYTIRDENGDLIDNDEHNIVVVYDLPTDGSVQAPPASVEFTDTGVLSATYNFPQGGIYRGVMIIHKDGIVADAVTYTLTYTKLTPN